MEKRILLSIAIIFSGLTASFSQIIESQNISLTFVDLRTVTPVGEVTINPPSAGKVIVRFDGKSTIGNMIMAASNSTTLDTNFEPAYVKNSNSRFSFSHSRVYEVEPGSQTFYGLVQSISDEVSIYATLTVEFIPNGEHLIESEDIIKTDIDLTNRTTVGQITINSAQSGMAIVHFDGYCISDTGDGIILAASNTTDWGADDGSVYVEENQSAQNNISFSHTRTYAINAGSNTFYAVAQNYRNTDGSGIASVYGTLTVEFIPDGDFIAESARIVKNDIDVTDRTSVGEVTISPAKSGKAVVRFDGECIPDFGDRIVLAASDEIDWDINDGSVSVWTIDPDIMEKSFSHSRVYDIAAGENTFYAVVHNYVDTDGSGITSVYGTLIVKFYPDNITATEKLPETAIQIFPNPAQNILCFESTDYRNAHVKIIDMKGQLINKYKLNSTNQIDISNLATGTYMVKIITQHDLVMKKLVIE